MRSLGIEPSITRLSSEVLHQLYHSARRPSRCSSSGIGESNPAVPLIRRNRSTGPSCPVRTPSAQRGRSRGVRRGIEPLCPGHSRPCLPKLPHGRSPGNRTQRVLVPGQAAHLAPRLRWRKALESNQSGVSATRLAVERRDHPDFAFHIVTMIVRVSRAQGRDRTGMSFWTQFLRLVCIPVPPPERSMSASGGNRTHITSLEDWGLAVGRHSRRSGQAVSARSNQWSCGESNSHATACKAVP